MTPALRGVIAGSLRVRMIGTASDAIARLGMSATAAMTNRIPVAFAVTYLIGVVGAAWFLAQLAPRIMGVDLAEECRKYEEEMQGGHTTTPTARREIEYRAYAVQPGSPLIARRVRELETLVTDSRLFVERIRRRDQVFDPDESTRVEAGDVLAVTGRRELRRAARREKLAVLEVDDPPLLDIPAEVLDVVVTQADIDGRTLADLANQEFARSVYLRRLTRAGTPVAMFPSTTYNTAATCSPSWGRRDGLLKPSAASAFPTGQPT